MAKDWDLLELKMQLVVYQLAELPELKQEWDLFEVVGPEPEPELEPELEHSEVGIEVEDLAVLVVEQRVVRELGLLEH